MYEYKKPSGQYFEEFVLSVLKQICVKHEQALITESDEIIKYTKSLCSNNNIDYAHFVCDAIAPNGIGDIKGIVFVEIRNILREKNLKSLSPIKSSKYHSLYIINQNYEICSKKQKDTDVLFWCKENIESWKNTYPIDYYGFYTDEIPDEKFLNFEEKNSANKELFFEESKNLSLALGAGASRDYGAKDWTTLIGCFYNELRSSGKISKIKTIKRKIGGSNLIDGQFAVDNLKNFMQSLYKGIYKNFSGSISAYPNSTLMCLANFIKSNHNKRRFNIITYNYDDYLEQLLSHIGIKFNCMYNKNGLINNELTIYHPHGYLPYSSAPKTFSNYRQYIVFSESEYHNLYNDPLSWAMVLQEHLYRENSFLFVGCSLSDPNLRRILENTKTVGKTHFAFMLKDGLGKKDQFIVHKHFMRLGVECIWFDNIIDYKNELLKL